MADTYVQVTNTGQTVFTLPFSSNYLLKSHVKVYKGRDLLAGTQTATLSDGTDYTFTSATQITLTTGLASGEELTIQRQTPKDSQLSPWNDGSNLTAEALNKADLQCLYFTQEQGDLNALAAIKAIASETASNTATTNVSTLTASQINKDGSVAMTGNLQLGTNKITGVGDPTAAQDAVTKAFLERTGSIQSAQIQDGTLVNNDVNASAAIAQSKLNIADATTSASGYMSAADKTKLEGCDSGAKDDQTASEIKTAYESNSDTNAFTDADHTKLDGIATSANNYTHPNHTGDVTSSGDGALTIANDAVTSDKIAANAIHSENIVNGTILTTDLANDAVTSAKIADNSINSEHYIDGSIDTDHLSSQCVTGAKIANTTIDINKMAANSVGENQYVDGSIKTVHIDDDAVTSDKIAASAVHSENIVDGTILTADLADSAVTEAKLGISNAGSNGQYLQKQSGNTGGLTWATVSGGGGGGSSVGGATGIDFNDDVKIRFGDTTTPDLEIYHNGLNSNIKNSTGWLVLGDGGSGTVIKGAANENAIACTANGAVEIYYDGNPRFKTRSNGNELRGSIQYVEGLLRPWSATGVDLGTDADRFQDLYLHNNAKIAGSLDIVGVINRGATNSSLQLSGSTASNAGANLLLYGESHSSHANQLRFRQGSTDKFTIDGSGDATFAGSVDIAGAIDENVFAITDASSVALDPDNGTVQTWTLGASRTATDSVTAGQSILLMVADGSSYAVTWPTMTWVGGSAPTLATSGYSCIELWKVGSTLYGSHVGDVA